MTLSDAQQLFVDFVNEAKSLIGVEFRLSVEFSDYPCRMIPNEKKSMEYFPPMFPKYDEGILCVLDKWIREAIADCLPTVIRCYAYFYAYTFYLYDTLHVNQGIFPRNKAAITFSNALCLLNGVPVDSMGISDEDICSMLKKLTGRSYQVINSVSATGQSCRALALSEEENRRRGKRLEYCREVSKSQRLNIVYGTKENPFQNIDEAIRYIEFLESEAVKSDIFLNSEFVTDKYQYDFGDYYRNGETKYCGLYKIPWAAANTAHVQNEFPKKSFVVTQLNPNNDDWEWLTQDRTRFIPLFSLKPNLFRRRFLFRGQTEEYIDPVTKEPTCKPNLFRRDIEKNPLPHRIKAYEMACLVARHPLVQLLGIHGVEIFNEPFRFQLNRLGLAQHYYNKTGLLDLTSDIEVAKFFATTSYRKDDDRYYPYLSDSKLGVLYIYDMRFPDEFKQTEPPQLSTIGKQYVFPRSAMQSGFLLNMPDNVNLHELPNVYRIFFRHDKAIAEEVARSTNFGDKYFPQNDPLSLVWQDIRDAENRFFTISKKAREMYLHQHPHEMFPAMLDSRLIANGFKLGTNQWPEFPEHVLADYYDNALAIWNTFCSDIEFLGHEGKFMKKSLMNLPLDPRYRRYFFR